MAAYNYFMITREVNVNTGSCDEYMNTNNADPQFAIMTKGK